MSLETGRLFSDDVRFSADVAAEEIAMRVPGVTIHEQYPLTRIHFGNLGEIQYANGGNKMLIVTGDGLLFQMDFGETAAILEDNRFRLVKRVKSKKGVGDESALVMVVTAEDGRFDCEVLPQDKWDKAIETAFIWVI